MLGGSLASYSVGKGGMVGVHRILLGTIFSVLWNYHCDITIEASSIADTDTHPLIDIGDTCSTLSTWLYRQINKGDDNIYEWNTLLFAHQPLAKQVGLLSTINSPGDKAFFFATILIELPFFLQEK